MNDDPIVGYVRWEMRGATPIYASDPSAGDMADIDPAELWSFVDQDDVESDDIRWDAT